MTGTSSDQMCPLPGHRRQGPGPFHRPLDPVRAGAKVSKMSVDICDADGLRIIYDRAERAATLRVRPGGPVEVAGLVRLDGTWEQPVLELDGPR